MTTNQRKIAYLAAILAAATIGAIFGKFADPHPDLLTVGVALSVALCLMSQVRLVVREPGLRVPLVVGEPVAITPEQDEAARRRFYGEEPVAEVEVELTPAGEALADGLVPPVTPSTPWLAGLPTPAEHLFVTRLDPERRAPDALSGQAAKEPVGKTVSPEVRALQAAAQQGE